MKSSKSCPDCGSYLKGGECTSCGWSAKAGAGISAWPRECMVESCGQKTEVVAVEARNPAGSVVRTNGGQAMFRNGETYATRKGWDFLRWITRCADCYLRELDGRKLSRIEPVENLVETVRAQREEQARAKQVEKTRSREQEAALLKAARQSYIPVSNEAAA